MKIYLNHWCLVLIHFILIKYIFPFLYLQAMFHQIGIKESTTKYTCQKTSLLNLFAPPLC